ncbi:MAG TPA: sigma-54 dependent transcriptional regulator [Polyangia bacterium]|jgi:two-component system response regulator HydG
MTDTRPRILIVDDNLEMARTLADGLAERGYDGVAVGSGREAQARLAGGGARFDAVVTDLRMPDIDGFQLLATSRELDPERPVIVMTAYSAIDSAVQSIRQGAYHYLTKPFKQDELAIFLDRALADVKVRHEAASLRQQLRARFSTASIIGHSAAMEALRDRIVRVADAAAPVLILGETGAGKGLVAQALHADSRRAAGPFVSVNCAALPEALLESELFGHVKGAFTGAVADRPGLFAEAHGGTLFLDEIAEMTPGLQAKLLHALESARVRPVGASKEREVDVRIVAATNRNLGQRVREGRFREDLMYRLDVVSLTVPPLRDRPDDIRELVEHFLADARARNPRSPLRQIAAPAFEVIQRYRWPGNVRELAFVIERLVVLAEGESARPDDLPERLRNEEVAAATAFQGDIMPMRELERRYAVWAVGQTGGHRGKAAEKLGIDPKTLRKWLDDND